LGKDPLNPRTHFYLAQTYDCLGKKHDAISYYKRRIALGGWYEEVWYSHYKIAMIHKELGNIGKMEDWVERAFVYNPHRAEAIYMAMKYFIDKRVHEKALYYYKKGHGIAYPMNDGLFIEDKIYSGEFEYWHTIIYYYLYPESRRKGAEKIIQFVNRYPDLVRNSYENMMFHVEPVRGEKTLFNFPDMGAFTAGNSSIVPWEGDSGGYLMNIRYVDYRVENGAYVWVPEGKVNTRNFFYKLDRDFRPVSQLSEITYQLADGVSYFPATINGYEDVRLYRDAKTGAVQFYGSCSNLNAANAIQIVHGLCDVGSNVCKSITEIPSARGRHCEKNWCMWPEKDAFIYEWSPYTLYSPSKSGGAKEGKILTTKTMPTYFRELRGSTIVMPFRGSYYCLTHQVVMREGRRNYIHVLVRLDGERGLPVEHTLPFCFEHHGTEYCIGMVLRNEWAYFIYTRDDKNLAMKKVHFDGAFEWMRVPSVD
jgi:tetratricopeptide (TPR) repeat protein